MASVSTNKVGSRVPRLRPSVGESTPVHELLERLGDTADEVASTLFNSGFFGPRQNDCFCPVAQYISAMTGQAASATSHVCVVGEFEYEDDGVTIKTFTGREWARTPPPVADAINAYDHGAYYFLEG